MSPVAGTAVAAQISFPRVSGDEPDDTTVLPRERAFSPRERG